MIAIVMSKSDFCECYWCFKARAVLIIQEPTFEIFPEKKTYMCERCFRMRKQIFPFELLKYEVLKYQNGK